MNLDRLHAIHSRLSRRLAYYLDHVVINSSPRPRAWGLIREPWQDELLRHKVPMFEALAGLWTPPQGFVWNFCDVLPRGHDKSSLEGRLCSWLLLYSTRPINAYILAADRDQGRLIVQAMREEAELNPWVSDRLTFAADTVTGPSGTVTVLPADVGGANGLRGNLYIFDEVTNWDKPKARDMWRTVMSGTAKVNPTVCGVLTNAGYIGSWQEKVIRPLARSKRWHYSEAPGPLASWMDAEKIAELRTQLASPAEARRLYDNKWINAAEELDYLSRDEVLACFDDTRMYRPVGDARVRNYIVSIDYGPKRDRTACCVIHREGGLAVVDRLDVWAGPCEPSEVLAWCKEIQRGFRVAEYVVDPYQLGFLIESLRRDRCNVHEYLSRGGAGNIEIATVLRGFVATGSLRLYPGAGHELVDELSNLIVKRKSYGFRIDHDSSRHDDQAVCLAMALVRSHEYPT